MRLGRAEKGENPGTKKAAAPSRWRAAAEHRACPCRSLSLEGSGGAFRLPTADPFGQRQVWSSTVTRLGLPGRQRESRSSVFPPLVIYHIFGRSQIEHVRFFYGIVSEAPNRHARPLLAALCKYLVVKRFPSRAISPIIDVRARDARASHDDRPTSGDLPCMPMPPNFLSYATTWPR
jgi:hypothetical protein